MAAGVKIEMITRRTLFQWTIGAMTAWTLLPLTHQRRFYGELQYFNQDGSLKYWTGYRLFTPRPEWMQHWSYPVIKSQSEE